MNAKEHHFNDLSRPYAPVRTDHQPAVDVVAGDAALRDSICVLLQSLGWNARGFGTLGDYLAASAHGGGRCLVIDMDGEAGLAEKAQQWLHRGGNSVQVVFVTMKPEAHDTWMRCLRGHVVLEKPLSPKDLTRAVSKVLTESPVR